MSDSSAASVEGAANVMVVSPERAQCIAAAFITASLRTGDDAWRLPDGTPVSEVDYFAWVGEIRRGVAATVDEDYR